MRRALYRHQRLGSPRVRSPVTHAFPVGSEVNVGRALCQVCLFRLFVDDQTSLAVGSDIQQSVGVGVPSRPERLQAHAVQAPGAANTDSAVQRSDVRTDAGSCVTT